MTVATVTVYDATHGNISHLPKGQAAGYSTGSGSVPWTQADWDAHPGAVRIDQSPVNTPVDELCDVLDVEQGAATPSICALWAKTALDNYHANRRTGQRSPAIYMSQSQVTPVVNALIAGGVGSGVGLWVAHWGITQQQAAAQVASGSGPFPVIGVQYQNAGLYDISEFSVPWLNAVSRPKPPAPGPSQTGTVTVSITGFALAAIDGKRYNLSL